MMSPGGQQHLMMSPGAQQHVVTGGQQHMETVGQQHMVMSPLMISPGGQQHMVVSPEGLQYQPVSPSGWWPVTYKHVQPLVQVHFNMPVPSLLQTSPRLAARKSIFVSIGKAPVAGKYCI